MLVIQFVIKRFTSQKRKMSVPSLDKTEIYLQNSASTVEVWDALFILYVDRGTANFVGGALLLVGEEGKTTAGVLGDVDNLLS